MNNKLVGRGRPVGTTAQKSDAVKRVRELLGLTQMEMAVEMRCSVSAIQRMERLNVLPGKGALMDAFERLAKRAGVAVESE